MLRFRRQASIDDDRAGRCWDSQSQSAFVSMGSSLSNKTQSMTFMNENKPCPSGGT